MRKTIKCPDCGTEIILASLRTTQSKTWVWPKEDLDTTKGRLGLKQTKSWFVSTQVLVQANPTLVLYQPKTSFEKSVGGLQLDATLTKKGIAEHFNISWQTVKDVEKRWLIKQAYGFRDFKYFRLKIFDLSSTDIRKRL